MTKKKIMIVMSFLTILLLVACNASEDDFLAESEEISKEFLTSYYTVTEEEMLKFSEIISPEEVDFKTYALYLEKQYEDLVDPVEIDRLISNRYLDFMYQLAYTEETLFEIKTVELILFLEEDDLVIYDYIVEITGTNIEVENLILEGKIRVDKIDDTLLITHAELDFSFMN